MPNIRNPEFLSEQDVRRILDVDRLLDALEFAFRDRYPLITIPPRTQIELTNGIFLVMSCYERSGKGLGMKLVTVRKEPKAREDRVQATYFLLDPESAQPRLIIAANYLTDIRTAATSAIATKYLALEGAFTLGIFGTGRLARAHLQVLPRVRNFGRVLVCGRDAARTADFVSQESSISIQSVDARTCAAESDVLCTCTASPEPLFDGRDLRPGAHLNLTGAFQPQTREVDTRTMQRARIVVETYGGAPSEAGDLLIPMREGAIPPDHIAADLYELVSGKKQGRRNPEEITVFKSVGCALEDLVTAELLGAAAA
jgi:ornithine cyclodeaminase/alanine dehydrogenase-like protein (mu-crystallin family)